MKITARCEFDQRTQLMTTYSGWNWKTCKQLSEVVKKSFLAGITILDSQSFHLLINSPKNHELYRIEFVTFTANVCTIASFRLW